MDAEFARVWCWWTARLRPTVQALGGKFEIPSLDFCRAIFLCGALSGVFCGAEPRKL